MFLILVNPAFYFTCNMEYITYELNITFLEKIPYIYEIFKYCYAYPIFIVNNYSFKQNIYL